MAHIPLLTGAANYNIPLEGMTIGTTQMSGLEVWEAWHRQALAKLLKAPDGPRNTVYTDPMQFPPVSQVAEGNPARAHLSVGAWVVQCPNDAWGWPATPGWPMLCLHCGNHDINGMWRRVEFPEYLEALHKILQDRPCREAQNWHGESLGHVMAEQAMRRDLTPEEANYYGFGEFV